MFNEKYALSFWYGVSNVTSWSPHKTFRMIYFIYDTLQSLAVIWGTGGDGYEQRKEVSSPVSGWARASQGRPCHIWPVWSAAQKLD